MTVRELIAMIMQIKDENLNILDGTVFFSIKGEDNDVEINGVSYDPDGDLTLYEDEQSEQPSASDDEPEETAEAEPESAA